MFLMCEIVTAAEYSYFEHVCNYSMSALVNGCHVSKQTLAPILNIQPSHLVTVLQPGVTSCMLGTIMIISLRVRVVVAAAALQGVKLAAYRRM
jgi:hypothetical protein